MTPERWRKVKELFHVALERQPEERAALLAEACRGDAELGTAVNRLLEQHYSDDGFLEAPPEVPDTAGAVPADRACPERIGSYELISVLGSGGMGTVYLARQEKPKREVALKVVRARFSTAKLLRRFEHEAEVLGRLQHPGIAQIYEAGTYKTADVEQPFFAMELIRGRELTEHAAERSLGTRQRLELLAKICEAVQHAHQKGVIHRDLKPSNVLVDAAGQPKVLDFGVARATDADVQVTTLQTDVGQLVGTIPYMSPEQVSGDPNELDTRSDVYTLGVIGYELLGGRLPYDVRRRTVPESVRVIREEDPTPLSSVNRVFRGDLDTIFAKALEKDKARRYQSASDLAADIGRYLRDEPIIARRPSAMYQLRKFARRHRALVGGLAVGALAVALALVLTSAALVRAVRSDRRAAQRLAEARAVNDFLNNMLAAVDPDNALGHEVTVREVVDAAAEEIESGSLADQPAVEAEIRVTIGTTYYGLGMPIEAEGHLRAALITRRALHGDEHPDVATSLHHLALPLLDQAKYDEAERLMNEALRMRRKLLGDEHPEVAGTLGNLAGLHLSKGEYAEGEPLLREALAISREAFGDEHRVVANELANLASFLRATGDYDGAEPLYREALAIKRKLLGDEHPDIAANLANLAGLLLRKGDYAGAEPLLEEALAMRRKLLGNDHTEVASSLMDSASLLSIKGDETGAERLNREALAILRKLYGNEHPHVAVCLHNLASLLSTKGDYTEAEGLLREALGTQRRLFGEEHPEVARTLCSLAGVLNRHANYTEAEAFAREGLALRRKLLGDEHPDVASGLTTLAESLHAQANYAEAEELDRQALAIRRRVLGDEHPAVAHGLRCLAETLLAQGNSAAAEPLLHEALAILREALPDGHRRIADTQGTLGRCLVLQQRYEAATPLLLDSHRILTERFGDDSAPVTEAARRLVELYDAWGQPEQAAAWRAKLPTTQPAQPVPTEERQPVSAGD